MVYWTTGVARAEDPGDAPKEVNLKSLLDDPDRPATNGVQLRTPKAEVVQQVDGKGLRVHWEVRHSGKRWPLVILAPDIERKTSGDTRLTLYAQGTSGKAYAWTWESPTDPFGQAQSNEDWFLTVDRKAGKAEGDVEVELRAAKEAFLKHLAKELDADKPPPMYVRLQHWPRDRGEHLKLDAWTGPLIGPVTKVTAKDW
jgi:hypothetical protein